VSHSSRSQRLGVEALESRLTPATSPTFVGGIPDAQFLVNRSSGALAFQVADPDAGDLANLTITATVETTPDQSFLPAGSIVFSGSGANRTVTVTPAPGKTGRAAIAVRITDPTGRNSTDRFTITVRGYDDSVPLLSELTFADTSGYTLPNPADYPGGVFYVAPEVSTAGGVPAGRATNLNTAASPLTVREAFDRIDAIPWNRRTDNVAVIFRGGDYRGVNLQSSYKNALLLQAYPDENPVLKGTEVVTNWTASGGKWYTSSDPAGDLSFEKPRGTSEFGNFTGEDVDFVDPVWNPLSANREQVFIDGRPKWQVGSLAEVAADTFFVDYAAHRIYIGENPAAKSVEVTAHEFAMKLWFIADPDQTSVRGLNFTGYGSVGLWVGGISARVEDGVFAWNGVNGLYISSGSPDSVVEDNQFVANGNGGARIQAADRVRVLNNVMRYNGVERPNTAWDAAGTKISLLSDALVKGNVVEWNYATGIWYDSSTFRTMTVDNVVRFNSSGVFVEISHDDTVAFNIIRDNSYGILVSGASDTRIYNNTLVNNGTAVVVREDPRINDPTLNTVGSTTRPAEALVGNTWDTYGTVLVNNIYSGVNETILTYGTTIVELSRTSDQPGIYTVIDQDNLTDPNKTKTLPMTSASMVAASNYNLYYDPSATPPAAVRWDPTATPGGQVAYGTPGAFAAAVPGYESNAVTGNPLFVGTPGDDRLYYRLRALSPAAGKGTTVPADILAAAGRDLPTYLGAVPPDAAPTVTIGSPSVPGTARGPVTFTVTYSDSNFDSSSLTAADVALNTTGTATGTVTVSPGTGSTRIVTVTNIRGTGTLGVSIAAGTAVDAAGNPAPAAGPSGTVTVTHTPLLAVGTATGSVRLFNTAAGRLVLSFRPFDAPKWTYTGAVQVATGDLNRDGVADLYVAAAESAGGKGLHPYRAGKVFVYDGAALARGSAQLVRVLTPFAAHAGPDGRRNLPYRNGLAIAVADLNGDGTADLIAGTRPPTVKGGLQETGRVAVVSGVTGAPVGRAVVPFGPGYTGGLVVAAGDLDGTLNAAGQPQAEVAVTRSGPLGKQLLGVRVFKWNGGGLAALKLTATGANLTPFAGIRGPEGQPLTVNPGLAFVDPNGDGRSDLVVSVLDPLSTPRNPRVRVATFSVNPVTGRAAPVGSGNGPSRSFLSGTDVRSHGTTEYDPDGDGSSDLALVTQRPSGFGVLYLDPFSGAVRPGGFALSLPAGGVTVDGF
jgi:parallel beta-helix repeat protein